MQARTHPCTLSAGRKGPSQQLARTPWIIDTPFCAARHFPTSPPAQLTLSLRLITPHIPFATLLPVAVDFSNPHSTPHTARELRELAVKAKSRAHQVD